MGFVNQLRYMDFKIVDINSNPIPGRVLSDWSIIFERNEVTCVDSLSLLDHGDGRYAITYIPSSIGHDYLSIFDSLYGVSAIDVEDIVASSAVASLTENFGSTNALKVLVPNPTNYILYVFDSSTWIQGSQDPIFSLGFTALDSMGNWINPIAVSIPGTYHVVIINPIQTQVVFPFLQVS